MKKALRGRHILIGSAGALLIAGIAGLAPPPAIDNQIRTGLATIDADGNGTVNRAEWKLAGGRTFAILDSDKDGMVSAEEFALMHSVTFNIIDRNRDLIVTADEVNKYKQLPWTLGWR